MISHYPAKLDSHRHCGSADIMILVCLLFSQDHVVKESCDFMGRSPLREITISLSLVAIDTAVVEIL